MSKSKRIKKLLLVGPGIPEDQVHSFLEDPDCLVIGDGKRVLSSADLASLSGTVDRNTEIEIHAHGSNTEAGHGISLFIDKPLTSEVMGAIEKLNPGEPKQIHLLSCFSGSAKDDARKLAPGSVLVSHAREDAIMLYDVFSHKTKKKFSSDSEGKSVCEKMLINLPHDIKDSARYSFVQPDGSVKTFVANIEDIDLFATESTTQSLIVGYRSALEKMDKFIPSWMKSGKEASLRVSYDHDDIIFLGRMAVYSLINAGQFEAARKILNKEEGSIISLMSESYTLPEKLNKFALHCIKEGDKSLIIKLIPHLNKSPGFLETSLKNAVKSQDIKFAQRILNVKYEFDPEDLAMAMCSAVKRGEIDLANEILHSRRPLDIENYAKAIRIAIERRHMSFANELIKTSPRLITNDVIQIITRAVKWHQPEFAASMMRRYNISPEGMGDLLNEAVINKQLALASYILDDPLKRIDPEALCVAMNSSIEQGNIGFAQKILFSNRPISPDGINRMLSFEGAKPIINDVFNYALLRKKTEVFIKCWDKFSKDQQNEAIINLIKSDKEAALSLIKNVSRISQKFINDYVPSIRDDEIRKALISRRTMSGYARSLFSSKEVKPKKSVLTEAREIAKPARDLQAEDTARSKGSIASHPAIKKRGRRCGPLF
ncbi:MAG: hypothetical protein RLN62_05355 [Rickettsiales bacterium]